MGFVLLGQFRWHQKARPYTQSILERDYWVDRTFVFHRDLAVLHFQAIMTFADEFATSKVLMHTSTCDLLPLNMQVSVKSECCSWTCDDSYTFASYLIIKTGMNDMTWHDIAHHGLDKTVFFLGWFLGLCASRVKLHDWAEEDEAWSCKLVTVAWSWLLRSRVSIPPQSV